MIGAAAHGVAGGFAAAIALTDKWCHMIAWILASAACKILPVRNRLPAVPERETAPNSPLLGMRFQLLLALGVLDRGHLAVLRIDQPQRNASGISERRPQLNFTPERTFAERIVALWVPGTMHPAPVGKALLELGWIEPSTRQHWVPLLRYFAISENGRRNLLKAREWWNELGPLQKLAAMVAE